MWCLTLVDGKMTAIFQLGLFEIFKWVPSLALGLAVLGSSVHLTAIYKLVVCLP